MTHNRIGLAAIISATAALSLCWTLSGDQPESNAPQAQHTNDMDAYKSHAYALTISTGATKIYGKGDFNGDGEGDYLAVDTATHKMVVWLGWTGHGFVRQSYEIPLGDAPYALAIADFKSDDAMKADDVALGSFGANVIYLFAGQAYTVDSAAKTAFQFNVLQAIPVEDPRAIALGKFSRGYNDAAARVDLLIVRDASAQTVELWAGNGSGVFAPAVKMSLSPEPIDDILPGEQTGDKYVDIVTTGPSGTIRLMKNDGSGGFAVFP